MTELENASKTPEQLGIGQKDTVRLPDGLEVVGNGWFRESDVSKVVVSSSVRKIGELAFAYCRQLHEVVFEPESCLQRIENGCFYYSGIRSIVIPKSVMHIGRYAFSRCKNLSALSFEEGSQLKSVGERAFHETQLRPETVRYPRTLRASRHGKEW